MNKKQKGWASKGNGGRWAREAWWGIARVEASFRWVLHAERDERSKGGWKLRGRVMLARMCATTQTQEQNEREREDSQKPTWMSYSASPAYMRRFRGEDTFYLPSHCHFTLRHCRRHTYSHRITTTNYIFHQGFNRQYRTTSRGCAEQPALHVFGNLPDASVYTIISNRWVRILL